jgi:hypothetical protein
MELRLIDILTGELKKTIQLTYQINNIYPFETGVGGIISYDEIKEPLCISIDASMNLQMSKLPFESNVTCCLAIDKQNMLVGS